jgi:hypothetical protein
MTARIKALTKIAINLKAQFLTVYSHWPHRASAVIPLRNVYLKINFMNTRAIALVFWKIAICAALRGDAGLEETARLDAPN